jgi:hypothetical protein
LEQRRKKALVIFLSGDLKQQKIKAIQKVPAWICFEDGELAYRNQCQFQQTLDQCLCEMSERLTRKGYGWNAQRIHNYFNQRATNLREIPRKIIKVEFDYEGEDRSEEMDGPKFLSLSNQNLSAVWNEQRVTASLKEEYGSPRVARVSAFGNPQVTFHRHLRAIINKLLRRPYDFRDEAHSRIYLSALARSLDE